MITCNDYNINYIKQINRQGTQILIMPGGWTDQTLAVGAQGQTDLITKM